MPDLRSMLVSQKDSSQYSGTNQFIRACSLVEQSSSARVLHDEIKDHVHQPSVERVSEVKLPDVLEF